MVQFHRHMDNKSQNIHNNSTIDKQINIGTNIVYNYFYSTSYQNILTEIQDNEEALAFIPEKEIETRNKLILKIEKFKKQKADFQREIVQLAEVFTRIELNSERLREAKKYFDSGRLIEASALLNMQHIQSEIITLNITTESTKRKASEANIKRKQLSNELLVKAQITALMFNNVNRITDVEEYFNMSLQLHKFFDNCYNYADFQRVHENYKKSLKFFQLAYKVSNKDKFLQAQALHAIGNVLYDLKEYEKALQKFIEADNIWAEIIDSDWGKIAPKKAITDNALGNTYGDLALINNDIINFEKSEEYHEKALGIRLKLVQLDEPKYKPDLALTYMNLAVLKRRLKQLEDSEKYYRILIPVYKELEREDAYKYGLYVAHLYNNLAYLFMDKQDFPKAKEFFEFAKLQYQKIAKLNPIAHEQWLGMAYANLAKLYTNYIFDYELATLNIDNAKKILSKHKSNPKAMMYLDEALKLEKILNSD